MQRLSPMNSMLLIATMHEMRTMKKTLMKQLMILNAKVKMEQLHN
jgi:hypothetical protein